MGLGLAIVLILLFGAVLGFMVIQAKFAARKWRQVIAEGDRDALDELLSQTLEAWRSSRPPKGAPPADWAALSTAAVVAADHERIRVSLLAEPDVRVIEGRREVVGTEHDVARRVAVRMAERLMYEVPYVSFREVQVDVQSQYRSPGGDARVVTLLTTRVTREQAASADWERGTPEQVLAGWRTRESSDREGLDPDLHALITEADVERSEPRQGAA